MRALRPARAELIRVTRPLTKRQRSSKANGATRSAPNTPRSLRTMKSRRSASLSSYQSISSGRENTRFSKKLSTRLIGRLAVYTVTRASGRRPRTNSRQLRALSPPPTIAMSELSRTATSAIAVRPLSQSSTRGATSTSCAISRCTPWPVSANAPHAIRCGPEDPAMSTSQCSPSGASATRATRPRTTSTPALAFDSTHAK